MTRKFVSAVFFMLCILTGLDAADNRILLIGDSITQGVRSSDDLGFRNDLYDSLSSVEYPFEMVGSSGSSPYFGHFKSGGRIGQFYRGPGGDGSFNVATSMDAFEPHVAVIHLGTNDAFFDPLMRPYCDSEGNLRSDTVAGKLAHLVQYLIRWADGTRGNSLRLIVVSRVIPNAKNPENIDLLNQEISLFIQDVQEGRVNGIPADMVKMVDQYSAFDQGAMFDSDGTHPNDEGYAHMGKVLFSALAQQPMLVRVLTRQIISGLPDSIPEDSLGLIITNGFGQPMPDVPVHFQKLWGSVTLSAESDTTDSTGLAYVTAFLGSEFDTSGVRTTFEAPLMAQAVPFWVYCRDWIEVRGSAVYHTDHTPLPMVHIMWEEQEVDLAFTDSTGEYSGQLSVYSDLTLHAEKEAENDSRAAGILSYDAALTARHAVGLDTLEGLFFTAADTDGDGVIRIDDAMRIARYAVGLEPGDSSRVGQWHFMPEKYAEGSVAKDLRNRNFTGVLIGDVHGGWTARSRLARGAGVMSMSWTTELNGDTLVTTLRLGGNPVYSCDFDLLYDSRHAQFLGFEDPGGGNMSWRWVRTGEGKMRGGMICVQGIRGEEDVLTIRWKLSGLVDPDIRITQCIVNATRLYDLACPFEYGGGVPLPEAPMLHQAYPNPFNDEVMVAFTLPERIRVHLRIYNLMGQHVITLSDEVKTRGAHVIRWDGRNRHGVRVSSGLYLIEMTAGRVRQVAKVEMIR
ncbi:MAG TPA: T9SS type A sorting domain-containing protein [bacterium]|nr:T9SS type A sorting domain-containing protein [bacterium]